MVKSLGILYLLSTSFIIPIAYAQIAQTTFEKIEEAKDSYGSRSDTKILSLSTFANFTCVVTDPGTGGVTPFTTKCWGQNNNSQLGGFAGPYSAIPITIDFNNLNTFATKVAVGLNHACALLADSTVACWGGNQYRQLGNGSSLPVISSPSRVVINSSLLPMSGVVDIESGEYHTCAIYGPNRRIKCWGHSSSFKRGNNVLTQNIPYPNDVVLHGTNQPIEQAYKLTAGRHHSCAIIGSNSEVFCWGANLYGQLGNSISSGAMKAVQAISAGLPLQQIREVALTQSSTCVVHNLTSNTSCVGVNNFGQLGSTIGGFPMTPPIPNPYINSLSFTPVISHLFTGIGTFPNFNFSNLFLQNVNTISGSANNQFVCANLLFGNTNIVCWGHFKAIYGTTASINMGVPYNAVGSVSGAPQYTWSDYKARAINLNNSILSASAPESGLIRVGSTHGCQILRSIDGDVVVCWGSNNNGQLGVMNPSSGLIPGPGVSVFTSPVEVQGI
jgi:hypothetical protein